MKPLAPVAWGTLILTAFLAGIGVPQIVILVLVGTYFALGPVAWLVSHLLRLYDAYDARRSYDRRP